MTQNYSPTFLLVVSDMLELFHCGKVWPERVNGNELHLRVLQRGMTQQVLFRSMQPFSSEHIVSGLVSYMHIDSTASETSKSRLVHADGFIVEYTQINGPTRDQIATTTEAVYFQVGSHAVVPPCRLFYNVCGRKKSAPVMAVPCDIVNDESDGVASSSTSTAAPVDSVATRDDVDRIIAACNDVNAIQAGLRLMRTEEMIRADLELCADRTKVLDLELERCYDSATQQCSKGQTVDAVYDTLLTHSNNTVRERMNILSDNDKYQGELDRRLELQSDYLKESANLVMLNRRFQKLT